MIISWYVKERVDLLVGFEDLAGKTLP